MRFTKLKLGSKNLHKQQKFYVETLGLKEKENTSEEIILKAGTTELIFSKKIKAPNLYHFAFLIPTGSLEASIQFIESKGIALLPFHGEKIIHFDTGRSIYFFDPDGNIAEFIERPLLDYPDSHSFEIQNIISVNEIGLPVSDTLETSNDLMINHRILPLNPKSWNENFCWVGNHEGAVIVVKEGRHWMPTEIPAVINDLELEYTEGGVQNKIVYKSTKLAK